MTALTIAERVAAGAAWLDAEQPGWVDRIDLDRLNLASSCRCILGQLFNDYFKVGLHPNRKEAMGFQVITGDPYTEYEQLEAAWIALIEDRRIVAAGPLSAQDCSHRDDPGHDHEKCVEGHRFNRSVGAE